MSEMADQVAEREKSKAPVQAYARWAGVLFLVSIAAGGFGEGYAPGLLIEANDAAATVANLREHEMIYRLSFAAYLIEAMCDITIALIFYVLLRPVSRGLSLLAAFFGILSTAIYAACEVFYFGLPRLLINNAEYLQVFSREQLDALTLASLRLFGVGAGMFLAFYGLAWVIRGWLMIRSGYLPKVLGVLMIVGGLGFMARTFTSVLAPQYTTNVMLFLMAPGGALLALWLIVKGVDAPKWKARPQGL